MHDVDKYFVKEMAHDAMIGPFFCPPFSTRVGVSPISTREKRDSADRRIILDLSFPPGRSVNDGIQKDWYYDETMNLRYPSIDTLTKRVKELGKGCLLWKIDMSRWFRQLPLCPRDYSMIGMRWRNLLFFDKVVPMGLRSAAFCAQRVSSAITYIHAKMGYWATNYLDDFGSAEPSSMAWDSFQAMRRTIKQLGAKEAVEKAVEPCTRMEFLGNTVDSIKMTIEVSEARKIELLNLIQIWLEQKQDATIRELQSLIGKLSFVTNCVKQGRVFICRMLNWLREFGNGRNKIPEDMKLDLLWWKDFLPKFNGTCILWLQDVLPVDKCFATDASLTGGGGVSDDQGFHVKFPGFILEQVSHISQLELLTVVIALKIWDKKFSGHVVRISVDNLACVFTINKGSTTDKFMQKCMREIVWLCSSYEILLRAVHIRTEVNTIPDLLSRWYNNSGARHQLKSLVGNTLRMKRIKNDDMKFVSPWY